jgi:predicted DNA-binding ribbon-helix-helix protein
MEGQPRRAKRGLPSLVSKRPVRISGRNSGISVEDAFWDAIKEMAATQGIPVLKLVSEIDRERVPFGSNLSSAVRLFVLNHYRALAVRAQVRSGDHQ